MNSESSVNFLDSIIRIGAAKRLVITVTSVVSDTVDDVNSWCGQIEGALTEDTLIVCDDPMSGRFVQVHNTGHSSNFHLAEVQVFGF